MSSLLQYLSSRYRCRPCTVIVKSKALTSSKDKSWGWWDVQHIEPWAEFNTETILDRFGAQFNIQMQEEYTAEPTIPFSNSILESEQDVTVFLQLTALRRVNLGLQLINRISQANAIDALVPFISFRPGRNLSRIVPDLEVKSVEDSQSGHTASIIRSSSTAASTSSDTQTKPSPILIATGDIKPSSSWSSAQFMSEDHEQRRRFRQCLAQVNIYMRKRDCDYGFLLTDTEFVAIHRKPGYHNALQLSEPFLLPKNNVAIDEHSLSADIALLALALWSAGVGSDGSARDTTMGNNRVSWPGKPDKWYPKSVEEEEQELRGESPPQITKSESEYNPLE